MPVGICPITGRELNWNPQAENREAIRAFCAPFAPCSASFADVEIPQNLFYDWLRTEDQERIGSCQGHGITSCAEVSWHAGTNGEVVQLSRLHAYIGTQRIDRITGDNGSTISGGIEYAKRGFVDELILPYRGDRYPSQSVIDQILAIPQDAQFAIRSGIQVTSWRHARQLIAGRMPISIGTIWGFSIPSDGVVRSWNPPVSGGGHARFLGEIRDGLPCERGSWGKNLERISWTESAFNAMLRHPYTVCIALSGLAHPVARRVDFTKELWK